MKVQIEIGKLKAARIFASKEETRYYLCGVYFEMKGSLVNLVATDGHRLIRIPTFLENPEQFEDMKDVKFIIPNALIDRIKTVRGLTHCDISICDKIITINYDHADFKAEEIDGTFPAYERVIPKIPKKHVGTTEIGFNPKYLADFAKVNEALGHRSAGVRMTLITDSDPAIITMGGGNRDLYLGVLMPMRV